MMDITAANTARLPTRAKPSDEPKRYRTRRDAEAAAVFTIGEHARREFEFTTAKVDGGWIWRRTDEVPPMTTAEMKASGGQRAVAAMALYVPPVMAPEAPVALPTFYDQMREAGALRSPPVPAPAGDRNMTKFGKRMIQAAHEGRAIARGEAASAHRKAGEKAGTETLDNGAQPAKRAGGAPTKRAGASGGNRYDWKGAAEAAKSGKMPKAPDFSAATHERFRPLLAEVVKAAKSSDSAALSKITINPISSSPKAIAKFRDLCLLALKG